MPKGRFALGGLSAAKDRVYRGKALDCYTKFTHGLMAVSLSGCAVSQKRAGYETLLNRVCFVRELWICCSKALSDDSPERE